MKKHVLITLAFAAATALTAGASSATATTKTTAPAKAATVKQAKPVSAAAEEEAATIEKFAAFQDAAIASFKELGQTLEGVTDEASANAAAPAVRVLSAKLYGIITGVEALGEPSEAVQQAIMSRMANKAEKEELADRVMMPLLNLMMQESPCYGSTALYDELTALLENIQGAAGTGEEEEEDSPEGVTPLQEPDADEAAANAAEQ